MRNFLRVITIFFLVNCHVSYSSLATISSLLGEKQSPTQQKNSFLDSINKQIITLEKEKEELTKNNTTNISKRLEKIHEEVRQLKEKLLLKIINKRKRLKKILLIK